MMIPDERGEKYMAVEPDEAAETTLKEGRFDEVKKYPLGQGSASTPRRSGIAEGGAYASKMGVIVFQNVLEAVPGSASLTWITP